MNFKHTEHTKEYFLKCEQISEQLKKFDWTSVHGLGVDLNKGNDNLKYQFLKVSSKLFTKIEKTDNDEINFFLDDPNILSVGIISLGANSEVELHKDHDYWLAPFHRVHIPLNAPGAYFTYGNDKIIWEMGKVYIFNVMGISHGALNNTDEDFEMVYIDITQSPIEEINKKPLNALAKEYQKKLLEVVPSDLLFTEYKKNCTEEEIQAEKQYLDHYNRNLEIG